MKADILPVVTSSDINSYSMARAFHEAYGVKSLMIARKISGTIDYSKILDFRCEPNLTDDDVFMDTLRGIYEEFKDQYKNSLPSVTSAGISATRNSRMYLGLISFPDFLTCPDTALLRFLP